MSDVVENLILAMESMGLPEVAAAVDDLSGSVDTLAASVDRADIAVAGGAAEAGKGGLMGALGSLKTLVAGGAIYEGVKQFASFESQMLKLKTQTGATTKEVANMSKGVLDMAPNVGQTPMALAEALYHIESTGVRGAKALKDLEVASKAAGIGTANLTETTTSMTAVLKANFSGIKNTTEAMGQLNSIVGAGDMTWSDLNSALGTGILATMKTMGVQVKGLGAALAELGDNNIRGAKAANILRMGFSSIVKPSEAAAKAMHVLGLEPLELSNTLRKSGIISALALLKERATDAFGTTKTGLTEAMAQVSEIFGGGRNSSGILTLMNTLANLKKKEKQVEGGGGVQKFNEDWIATTHTLSHLVDQLEALADKWLIKLGSAANWAAGEIEGLIKGFKQGKVWADLLVSAIGGVVAGLTAFLVISKGVAAVEAMTKAWKGLTVAWQMLTGAEIEANAAALANPYILVGAAIIGLTAALAILITHSQSAKEALLGSAKAIKEGVVEAFHWIENVAVEVFDWIKDHWQLLLAILVAPITGGATIIFYLFHKQILGAVQGVWSWIKGAWSELGKIISWPFEQAWRIIQGIATGIVHAFQWAIHQVANLLGMMLDPAKAVANLLSGHPGAALGDLKNLASPIVSVAHMVGFAKGGPVSASGAYLVGERGPELVYLDKGNYVQANNEIGAALPGLARDNAPRDINVNLVVAGRVLAQTVVKASLEAQSCGG